MQQATNDFRGSINNMQNTWQEVERQRRLKDQDERTAREARYTYERSNAEGDGM
jgi:catalase (peroxidase I)